MATFPRPRVDTCNSIHMKGPIPSVARCCEVTHNPCGTDTWSAKPCPCDQCQQWIMEDGLVMHRALVAATEMCVEKIAQLRKQVKSLGEAVYRSRGQWVHSVNRERCEAALEMAKDEYQPEGS